VVAMRGTAALQHEFPQWVIFDLHKLPMRTAVHAPTACWPTAWPARKRRARSRSPAGTASPRSSFRYLDPDSCRAPSTPKLDSLGPTRDTGLGLRNGSASRGAPCEVLRLNIDLAP
jgi:hypothetical protein